MITAVDVLIDVIYDHPDFVIVYKPDGVTMHSASKTDAPSILSLMPQAQNYHLVHRLDDPTSGCLILAKHAKSAAMFSAMFANQQIQKTYLALSAKKGQRKMGWVTGDMQKRRDGQWLLLRTQHTPARSFFIRKGTHTSERAFWVRPYSGKTHQIRVALKSNSASILGDNNYGGQAGDRLYLHAFALCFEWHGQTIDIHCLPRSGSHFISPEQQQLWLGQYEECLSLWPNQ
jgi:tRNA pseudouridine32 synthase/23S rRNA pseudouridine746 synthase